MLKHDDRKRSTKRSTTIKEKLLTTLWPFSLPIIHLSDYEVVKMPRQNGKEPELSWAEKDGTAAAEVTARGDGAQVAHQAKKVDATSAVRKGATVSPGAQVGFFQFEAKSEESESQSEASSPVSDSEQNVRESFVEDTGSKIAPKPSLP